MAKDRWRIGLRKESDLFRRGWCAVRKPGSDAFLIIELPEKLELDDPDDLNPIGFLIENWVSSAL